jgi:FMN phosphatase YigB (HAD superfamily)
MGGPDASPPKMIRQILNLNDIPPDILYDIIFCEDHRTPDSLTDSLKKTLGCPIDEFQRKQIKDFWQAQHVHVYELEGALNLVKNIARTGAGIHIVSNLWFPFYQKFREIFQEISDTIQSETLSFEQGVRKPSLEIYRRALNRSGAVPENAVMVGDSVVNDILPCAALGMKCIWFKSRPMEKEKLDEKRRLFSDYQNIFEADTLEAVQSIIELLTKSSRSGVRK